MYISEKDNKKVYEIKRKKTFGKKEVVRKRFMDFKKERK